MGFQTAELQVYRSPHTTRTEGARSAIPPGTCLVGVGPPTAAVSMVRVGGMARAAAGSVGVEEDPWEVGDAGVAAEYPVSAGAKKWLTVLCR